MKFYLKMKTILVALLLVGLPMTVMAEQKNLVLTIESASKIRRADEPLVLRLENKAQAPIEVWGFTEAAKGQPNLAAYLMIYVARVINGKRESPHTGTMRMLPPISDLQGRLYRLEKAHRWHATIRNWFPRNLRNEPSGTKFVAWAEFDDVQAAGYIYPKENAVGRVVSPVTEFEFP